MIDRFFGDGLGVLSCPFWSFSAVWCSVADTHLKLLGRVVCGASFLTGGVFEFDLAQCRSLAVLCVHAAQNQVHPLYGALPEQYPSLCVTRVACIAHPYT